MKSLFALVLLVVLPLVFCESQIYGQTTYSLTETYPSSSCSGNPIAFEFVLANVCLDGIGESVLASCNLTAVKTSTYSSDDCSGTADSVVQGPVGCFPFQGAGVSFQCGSVPIIGNFVHMVNYGEAECGGPAITGEAALQGVCIANPEAGASVKVVCDSKLKVANVTTCGNLFCNASCEFESTPYGCTDGYTAFWCFDSNGNLDTGSTTGTGEAGTGSKTTGSKTTTGKTTTGSKTTGSKTTGSKTTTGAQTGKTTTGSKSTGAATSSPASGSTAASGEASKTQAVFAFVFLFCLALLF